MEALLMSKISDLMIDLQEEIESGFLTFEQIAAKYEVPLNWVDEAAKLMIAEYDGQPDEAQEWESFDPDC
jgi:hypothetical protein